MVTCTYFSEKTELEQVGDINTSLVAEKFVQPETPIRRTRLKISLAASEAMEEGMLTPHVLHLRVYW